MSAAGEGRRLAGASFIYVVGSIASRGLAFLVLPLYTRYLSTSDFGIVAVTTTIASILGMVYPLGLHGAVARFYFMASSASERRAINGTLWLASLVIGGVLALTVDRLAAPLFAHMIPSVPFDPYIRLAIWTAFFSMLGAIPLGILQIEQRPLAYISVSLVASVVVTGSILLLVVFRQEGAYGYVRGSLIGALIAAIPFLLVTWRSITPVVRWDILKAALLYSLPLVPHAAAGWILELSDRIILSRLVPLSEVGLYAVGYQLGAAMSVVISAFTSAWVPILFRELAKEDPTADRHLARLATGYMGAVFFIAVVWALLSPYVIHWTLAARYAGSSHITQIVIGAYALNALYVIPMGFLFWRQATWLIPVVTIAGGSVNVALNLWLVPRLGTVAAAWNTVIGYGVMLLTTWYFATRRHRFPYEYPQIARLIGLAVGVYASGALLTPGMSLSSFFARVGICLSFPIVVLATRTVSGVDLRSLMPGRRK